MSLWIDTQLLISAFVTLFVIMDPPGTVPLFLALTQLMSTKERNKAAGQAILVSFGVVAGFALFGQKVLAYLHVSLPALQAAGGLLLLLVAMELLTGKMDDPDLGQVGTNVAMVPLGTPLLAGPGAIVATMVDVQQATAPSDWVALALALSAVHLCLYLAMRFASAIHKVLGESGTVLVSRIAGLLLAAIAVEMLGSAILAFVAQS
jgi:multiple antibiotic resistance protein